jgi:hypothetical protein
MKSLVSSAALAALMITAACAGEAAACGTNTGVYAYTPCRTDRDVLQCRREQDKGERVCGAHGCDCGILRSQCASTERELKSSDINHEGMFYLRDAAAYLQNCREDKRIRRDFESGKRKFESP